MVDVAVNAAVVRASPVVCDLASFELAAVDMEFIQGVSGEAQSQYMDVIGISQNYPYL